MKEPRICEGSHSGTSLSKHCPSWEMMINRLSMGRSGVKPMKPSVKLKPIAGQPRGVTGHRAVWGGRHRPCRRSATRPASFGSLPSGAGDDTFRCQDRIARPPPATILCGEADREEGRGGRASPGGIG